MSWKRIVLAEVKTGHVFNALLSKGQETSNWSRFIFTSPLKKGSF